MMSAVAICVLVGVAVVSAQWVNNFDGDAKLECSGDQVFSFLGSEHNNHNEDRRWQFKCKQAPGAVTDCTWSGFINGFDQPLLYTCPGDKVLNGMTSYHSDHHKDRRFMFKCCNVSKKSTKNCYDTDYINDWDQPMNFFLPKNYYIKGVSSSHNNHYEDRKWILNLCQLA